MSTRRRSRRARWARRALAAFAGLLLLVVIAVVWLYVTVSLPEEPEQLQTTVILDAEGNDLAELYKENRVDIPLSRVADVVEQAVVDTEDRHFYEHRGIDPIGLTRAVVNDLRRRRLQGGSTITQQLVKNVYLTAERSLLRKAKEAVLAVKIERKLSKREILERYLNTVYFGRGAYGIEKAAQLYFQRHASELDVAQAALLAGLIRAPETADPTTAPDVARQRRAIALDSMVRAGDLSRAKAEMLGDAPLGALERRNPNQGLTGSTAHFAAAVRRWAVQEFGEQRALGGGLRIETTLDPKLQAAAEDAVASVLDRPDDPATALVAMTDDGAVVAMLGGKDFTASNVNLATGSRRPQAGSTFKPFVLAAALADDIPLTRRYEGSATKRVTFDGFPPYEVDNFGGESFGSIDLTDATAHSVNTVYAQLAADIGLDDIAETAHDLGVDSDVPVVPAMALGSANVSPLEMIRSYMTFATRGERVTPYLVARVTDADGDVLYEPDRDRRRVYPEDLADTVNEVLTQTIERGTGRASAIGRPAAGKTGTTSSNTDAWFVGYTPKLGAAVWLGYPDDTKRKMSDVHGRQVTGGSFPAQIWQRFMKAAVAGRNTGSFVEPEDGDEPARPSTTTSSSTTSEPDVTSTPEETTSTSTSTSTFTTAPESTTTTTEPP